MTYIKVLESFKDIHNKSIYAKNKFYEITDTRYEEILKNAKKLNKELIRLATEEETKEHFKIETPEIIENKEGESIEKFDENSDEKNDNETEGEVEEIETPEVKENKEDESTEEVKQTKKINNRRK